MAANHPASKGVVDRWSNDWTSFVEHVSSLICGGTNNEGLDKLFRLQTVRWQGIVEEIDLDEWLPAVTLRMKQIIADLGGGRTATLEVLSLPMAEDAISGWTSSRPGDRVLFEASLGSEHVPFPAIEVDTLESGRTLMTVSVGNGKLVQILEYGPADHTAPIPQHPPWPPDPLASLPNYKHCWDGSEPGWTLRGYSVILCKFTVEFDEVLGPTDEQIEFLRTISDSLAHGSSEDARKMIGNETRFVVPSIQDWTEEDLERITEQLDELGLGGEGGVDRRWSQLIPVSPSGTELLVDDKSLRREIVRRMANAGVPIEGDKKIVEWWWFLGYYVRLE